MLWAACCLGFFGFLRAGEFTCTHTKTASDAVLSLSNVAIDSSDTPQRWRCTTSTVVHLRHSKTDPLGVGAHLYLRHTGSILCSVAAVLGYLAIQPPDPGPVFICLDGSPLSRGYLIEGMRAALSQAGVDSSRFAGHSLRIGAATTAARAGFSDSFIQTLGRWKSSAFTYIRIPSKDLIAVAARMAGL